MILMMSLLLWVTVWLMTMGVAWGDEVTPGLRLDVWGDSGEMLVSTWSPSPRVLPIRRADRFR